MLNKLPPRRRASLWRDTVLPLLYAIVIIGLSFGAMVYASDAQAFGSGAHRWFKVADVPRDHLTIEHVIVSPAEVKAYEIQWTGEHVRGTLAISRLVRRGTEYHCTVVRTQHAPQSVIEHELKHCHGYDHHLT